MNPLPLSPSSRAQAIQQQHHHHHHHHHQQRASSVQDLINHPFFATSNSSPLTENSSLTIPRNVNPIAANMLVKVRTLTGKEIELDVEESYQVSQIKELVEEKEGIPPVQQRLIYGGKQMSDEKTVADYDIQAGATLHLVLALRGGSR